LVERANKNNIESSNNLDYFINKNRKFDLVVAFDVLEHINTNDIISLFQKVNILLKEEGYFISRFPNGDFFTSMIYQNGDLTHINHLGRGKIVSLCEYSNLNFIEYKNQALHFNTNTIINNFKILIEKIRYLIILFLVFIFFGRLTKVYSRNAIAVVKSKS
ncbi:MAG: methyltransferase domain-containing protein, partial [Cyanobium sp. MAG06]|nr:methyltransferase domain-containing protein [Cyanobium sp. MAG06]